MTLKKIHTTLLLFLLAVPQLMAQITGSQTVNVGDNITYSYTGFVVIPEWQAVNGTIISTSSSGSTFFATINWTTVGSGSVTFLDNGGFLGSLPVTISAAVPQAPTPIPGFVCGAGTVLLSATPGLNGNTINWYSQLTRGLSLGTGLTYTTPSLTTTTTYYITTFNTTTLSESFPRVAITASVYAAVGTPTGLTGATRCGTGTVTLSGTTGTNGTTLRWYANAAGGTALFTNLSYSPTVSATTTFYACSYNATTGCESSRLAVTATVNLGPGVPTALPVSRCGSGVITLTAVAGANGTSAKWYAAATGGTALATGLTYNPSITATTTYFVSTFNTTTTCESATRNSVVATLLVLPNTPTVTGYFGRYGFGPITLVASGAPVGSTYQWTTNADVNISGATSATYTTDYTATAINKVKLLGSNGCSSGSISVTGNVLPVPVVTTTGNPYLASGQSVVLTVQTGYATYQWKRDGVNISGATSNTYTANQAGKYSTLVTLTNGFARESGTLYVALLTNLPETVTNPVDTNLPATVATATRKNYVRTYTAKDIVLATDFNYTTFNRTKVSASTQYMDALGMPVQMQEKQASPQGKDLLVHAEYDTYGRVVKEYLPFSTNTTDIDVDGFRKNAKLEQYNFYRNGTTDVAVSGVAYSEKQFEPSPHNRLLKQASPGEAWKMGSGREAKMESWALGSQDFTVRKFSVTTANALVQDGSTYNMRELMVLETQDENGQALREYKDKEGRLVLRRTKGDKDEWLDTYYVYDALGNQRFVLPPLLNQQSYPFSQVDIDNLAYQYKYDARQRLIEKRVPGSGWVYIIYDFLDRPVLTQDAEQRPTNKWSFVKYDIYGRPVMTGETANTLGLTYSNLRTTIAASYGNESKDATNDYTLNGGQPSVTIGEVFTKTFYDDYLLPAPYVAAYVGEVGFEANITNNRVRGQVTATMVRNLDTNAWLETYSFYDDRYRPIQTTTRNVRGNMDRVSILYKNKLDPKPIKTLTVHNVGGGAGEVRVQERADYDDFDRPTTAYNKIGTNTEVRFANTRYNELSQVVEKNLHSTNGTSWFQSIDMIYNIRGQVKNINDAALAGTDRDLFGMELFYENGYTQKQYNGNISGAQWKSVQNGLQRSNGYVYDPLNRLRVAQHQRKNTTTSVWDQELDRYNEVISAYDANGNILALQRNGLLTPGTQNFGLIDNLTYTYVGNQLVKVFDATNNTTGFKDDATGSSDPANDYTFDGNGSLTKDDNKLVSVIDYNYLHLAKKVTKTSGDYVKYIYDAAGRKLQQEVFNVGNVSQKKTDYIGAFVYEGNVLQYINHSEGRIVMTGAAPEYQYHLKDHLGNVRITATTKPDVTTHIATLEDATQTIEQATFTGYSRIGFDLFDHSDAGTAYQYAQKLTGGLNAQVGLAKSFAVQPGDTIKAEAYAKYFGGTGSASNLTAFAGALLGAFGLAPPGVGETGTASAALNSYGGLVTAGTAHSVNTGPRAYLNILVFDSNYNLVDMAFKQLDAAYEQTGATKMPHMYMSRSLAIVKAGFAYVYVSNEGINVQDVWFDDIKYTHTKSPIVQADDYYAFGMQVAGQGYQKAGSMNNPFLYNGKEKQDELGLDWLDYGARMYMSDIGRWGAIDPLADSMRRWSPYNYAYDNPIRFIDPDGMEASDVTLQGTDTGTALNQLNSGLEGATLSMDGNGKLSYAKTEGANLNDAAKEIIKAIDDHTVDVVIKTTDNAQNSNGGALVGGSFMGTKVESDGTVKSTNEYDTPTGGRIDAAYNKPGGSLIHEITEGYEAAKMSQKSGQSSGPEGTPGSVYKAAHKAALKQPGSSITLTHYNNGGNMMNPIYDSKGRDITPSDASYHGTVWRAKGKLVHTISK